MMTMTITMSENGDEEHNVVISKKLYSLASKLEDNLYLSPNLFVALISQLTPSLNQNL
jgi:hypothetical protein